jgi:chaperonin cofactor prefoldin
MKTLSFVLVALAAGCSSPKPGRVVVTPRPSVIVPDDLTERVRCPEFVKAYHVSRYAESSRLLMHEAHTVFRVEGQATWNFHSPPGCFVLPSGTVVLTNAAFALPAVNDAVLAELNQQRAMTRAVTQQAESLNGSLRDFTAALANTRMLAEQNKTLREQFSKTEKRIEALEAELRKQPSQPAPGENENK